MLGIRNNACSSPVCRILRSFWVAKTNMSLNDRLNDSVDPFIQRIASLLTNSLFMSPNDASTYYDIDAIRVKSIMMDSAFKNL